MLRKVKLYGKLAEFVGHKEFDVQVNSVSQAVSFLVNNPKPTRVFLDILRNLFPILEIG